MIQLPNLRDDTKINLNFTRALIIVLSSNQGDICRIDTVIKYDDIPVTT